MRISKSLTRVYDIFEYVFNFLEKLGYEVISSSSSLSKSEYIEILNMSEMLGKDMDNIKIRISDHDLPVTYFNQNPYDYDLKSYKDNRVGTDGDAMPYGDFLEMMVDITPIKPKVKADKIELPQWFKDFDKIYALYKELDAVTMFPFFDMKYLPMSERKKQMTGIMKHFNQDNLTKEEIEDLGFIIKEYFTKEEYDFFVRNIKRYL